MGSVWIPVITGLISFVVFFALGWILGERRRRRARVSCDDHRWRVLLEKYPTFTQDRWKCDECGLTENFPHDQPPTKTATEICDMGHVHVAGYPEWEEWPDVVSKGQ